MTLSGPPRDPFETGALDYEQELSQGLRLAGESKEYFARARVAHLRSWWQRAGRPEPGSIIDYGCGAGDVTLLLAEAFPRANVLGVDPSKSFIEEAGRSLRSARIDFAVLDGVSPLDVPPADLVHVNGVVHHIAVADRQRFCNALARCVRTGGVVALFDNNPWNPGTHLVMRRISFDRGLRPVSSRTVVALLAAAGLQLRARSFLFYFPSPLRALRPLEAWLEWLPLGAQYALYVERSDAPPAP